MFEVPYYVPAKKSDIINKMAYAIEKKRVHSAKYWSKEQFQIWCHKDPVGKRSFKEAKAMAQAAYKAADDLGVMLV